MGIAFLTRRQWTAKIIAELLAGTNPGGNRAGRPQSGPPARGTVRGRHAQLGLSSVGGVTPMRTGVLACSTATSFQVNSVKPMMANTAPLPCTASVRAHRTAAGSTRFSLGTACPAWRLASHPKARGAAHLGFHAPDAARTPEPPALRSPRQSVKTPKRQSQ